MPTAARNQAPAARRVDAESILKEMLLKMAATKDHPGYVAYYYASELEERVADPSAQVGPLNINALPPPGNSQASGSLAIRVHEIISTAAAFMGNANGDGYRGFVHSVACMIKTAAAVRLRESNQDSNLGSKKKRSGLNRDLGKNTGRKNKVVSRVETDPFAAGRKAARDANREFTDARQTEREEKEAALRLTAEHEAQRKREETQRREGGESDDSSSDGEWVPISAKEPASNDDADVDADGFKTVVGGPKPSKFKRVPKPAKNTKDEAAANAAGTAAAE